MELSVNDMEILGRSARISFADETERESFRAELCGMIAHAQALQKPLLEFEALADEEEATVWREDELLPSIPREILLNAAPAVEGDYIVLPRTVEG